MKKDQQSSTTRGRPRKVDPSMVPLLREAMTTSQPADHGLNDLVWSVSAVQAFIRQVCDVSMSRPVAGRLVRDAGLRPERDRGTASSPLLARLRNQVQMTLPAEHGIDAEEWTVPVVMELATSQGIRVSAGSAYEIVRRRGQRQMRSGRGRARLLGDKGARLLRNAISEGLVTEASLCTLLNKAVGVNVSRGTLRRYLDELGFQRPGPLSQIRGREPDAAARFVQGGALDRVKGMCRGARLLFVDAGVARGSEHTVLAAASRLDRRGDAGFKAYPAPLRLEHFGNFIECLVQATGPDTPIALVLDERISSLESMQELARSFSVPVHLLSVRSDPLAFPTVDTGADD